MYESQYKYHSGKSSYNAANLAQLKRRHTDELVSTWFGSRNSRGDQLRRLLPCCSEGCPIGRLSS